MSDHGFDAEVITLLRDIAADPRASGLRIPEERLIKWVGRPDETLLPHGSSLTRAEKHLALAYREQAAKILLDACFERLTRPESLVFLERSARPDPSGLRGASDRLAHVVESKPVLEEDVLELLHQLEAVSASQLAGASLRLIPRDLTRNALALAFHMEGHHLSAERMFGLILSRNPDVLISSLVLENLGYIHCAARDYAGSYDWYTKAIRKAGNRWKPLAWRSVVALQLGKASAAVESARELSELDVPASILEELATRLETTRRAGVWEPTLEGLRLAREVRESMPEKVSKICDAFHP